MSNLAQTRQEDKRCTATTSGGRRCRAYVSGDLTTCHQHGPGRVNIEGRYPSILRRRYKLSGADVAAIEASVQQERQAARRRSEKRQRDREAIPPQHGGLAAVPFNRLYRRIVAELPGGRHPSPSDMDLRRRIYTALEWGVSKLPSKLVTPDHPAIRETVTRELARTAKTPAETRGRLLGYRGAA